MHFPIAMLIVYSVIKILPLGRWFPKVAWRDIERLLLVVGVGGAFLALATGETAEHLVRPNHDLVEMHSLFASISTWLSVALLLGELAAMVNKRRSFAISVFIEKVFCNRIVSTLIAFIALIAISITGLLGGVLAYGLTADPVAPFVLNILGITL